MARDDALAPVIGTHSGREHLKALFRLGASRFVRIHHPLDEAYEQLAIRAENLIRERHPLKLVKAPFSKTRQWDLAGGRGTAGIRDTLQNLPEHGNKP